MVIYPYKKGSKSAKALATELGVKRIKHTNSKFKGRYYKKVLNWGASSVPPQVDICCIINGPEAVAIASNKLNFFMEVLFKTGNDAPIPDFTPSKDIAEGWLRGGHDVVCRAILNGHSGAGISIVSGGEPLPVVPLYVKYVKKQQEYRVHIFNGEVIDVQRKARSRDVPDDKVNWKVRNHGNGFIFARGDANPDEKVLEAAKVCVKALSLDFGAADVVWNDREKRAYVLEVNTAPGLEGTTLEKYAEAIRDSYGV